MKRENTVKKHATHGFSQFTLTQNLLNNLQQFEITPTAKLVLLYLSSCYNPKKADMFPKQKTIAAKIGISERSVVRAISELIQAGLIIVECKYSNRYKFTSKIVAEPPRNEKIFEQENIDIQEADMIRYLCWGSQQTAPFCYGFGYPVIISIPRCRVSASMAPLA